MQGELLVEPEGFFHKIQKPIRYTISKGGCWNCVSHIRNKYPSARRIKASPRHRGMVQLHRYVFFLKEGYYPEVVMHTCDNIKCINPEHLMAGTIQLNNMDMVKKKRHAYGESNKGGGKNQKINDQLAKKIKTDLKNGISTREIAKKFKISRSSVCRIKRGTHWNNIKI